MTAWKRGRLPTKHCTHWYESIRYPILVGRSRRQQLDTCISKLDLHEFLGKVIQGLTDDSDEIKVICHMMLFRLPQLAPAAVSQRLDEITPLLEKSMKGATVTKDTVKQDLERAAELQRSTLRAIVALSKVAGSGNSPKFDKFVAEIRMSSQWAAEFKDLQGI